MAKNNEETKEQKINRILEWLSVIDKESESGGLNDNKIFWTEEMKNTYNLISRIKSGKIVLSGTQGSGKSTYLTVFGNRYCLENKNKKALVIPYDFLSKNIREGSKKSLEDTFFKSDIEFITLDINPKYADHLSSYIVDNRIEIPFEMRNSITTNPQSIISDMESLLNKKVVKNILTQAYNDCIASLSILFLDMPDYPINSESQVNKDLSILSELYKEWNYFGKFVLVLSMQSELKVNHFFLGKAHRIEIHPFTSEDVLGLFKLNFPGSIAPFSDESVIRLAQIARGNIRRFKKYGLTVLMEHLKTSNETITSQFVENTIPFQLKISDMERELLSLFPRSEETRALVVRLLEYLRLKNGTAPKQDINSEFSDFSPTHISKVLQKIDGKYITRTRRQKGKTRVCDVSLILNKPMSEHMNA